MSNFIAEWSGSYPNLCHGTWSIKYQGKSLLIPKDKIDERMFTYITYQTWHFEDWEEVYGSETDGLHFDEWIIENHQWIDQAFDLLEIEKSEQNYKDLYYTIQSTDFRTGSCGGCI